MTQLLLNFAMSAFVILSINACSTSNKLSVDNPFPSMNPNAISRPSTKPIIRATANPEISTIVVSEVLATRASFISFLNCVKSKSPYTATEMELYINKLNVMSDAQWTDISKNYQSFVKSYPALSCN